VSAINRVGSRSDEQLAQRAIKTPHNTQSAKPPRSDPRDFACAPALVATLPAPPSAAIRARLIAPPDR
jgi:hypothetical protein